MKKTSLLLIGSVVMLSVATPVFAQNGCINSPENPTVVLALVGSAGAFFASARNRIRARRKSTEK
jgi:XrtJ-associated TM-motif-TM protein